MRRGASLLVLGVVAAGAGCGASPPDKIAIPSLTSGATSAPLRPTLLARDLSLPEPVEQAEARGTSVLRPPQDMRSVEPLARAFFDAIVEEDLRQVSTLLVSPGGQFLSGGLGAATPLELWRQRFRLYDYGKLRGQSFVSWNEATLLRRADYEKKDLSIAVDDTDVFFRVPVSVPQGPGEPVFGSSVTFLLRRTPAGTKIVAYDEGRIP